MANRDMTEVGKGATQKELCTLTAVLQHGCAKQAAQALGLSQHTVNTHLANLRRKTGCSTLAQLVEWSRRAPQAVPKPPPVVPAPETEAPMQPAHIPWPGISDAQWAQIQAILPPEWRKGRHEMDQRAIVNGILYKLRTGCSWHHLPRDFGTKTTCHRHYQQWLESDLWAQVWSAFFDSLSEDEQRDWAFSLLQHGCIPLIPAR